MKAHCAYRDYTDKDLLSLLTSGNHDAFSEIYGRYAELLYRHAHKLLDDTEICNDLVQDTFVMLWDKRGKVHITESLSAYLYKAVRNRVFDYIARDKVAERYLDSIRDFANRGVCITEQHVREEELRRIIDGEKEKLSPRVRLMYELNREYDLSYSEIGKRLNISDKTVKKQVHNALKILRLKIRALLSLLALFHAI